MELLSEIKITGSPSGAILQLLQGDCTAIPKEHNADILVVSAFPNDYTPLPGSLMHALYEKGINVGEMAKNKAVNLVPQLGCWLSQPLNRAQQKEFNFKQILCFEPSRQSGAPETVVGNIFRCINNFVFDDDNNVIAMPVLATGKQKVPMETMLPAMLDACIFWLDSGIPLDYIKLVVKDEAQAQKALPFFELAKKEYASMYLPDADSEQPAAAPPRPSRARKVLREFAGGGAAQPAIAPQPVMTPPQPSVAPVRTPAQPEAKSAPTATDFDYFISYSHVHSPQVAELVSAMKAKDGNLNIFYDRETIPPGGLWIRQISDAIQRSKCVVCILSPQYRDSDVCWDEFQCAKAKEYRTKKSVIKTINFIADTDMPLIMSVYSYIDCTEADIIKLKDAVKQLC